MSDSRKELTDLIEQKEKEKGAEKEEDKDPSEKKNALIQCYKKLVVIRKI